MFGLGTWEIVLILGVALIVLGPDKLPTVARKLGKSVRDLRRAANDFTREMDLQDLKNPETWLPPDGAQAHGDLTDDELHDPLEESLDDSHADSDPHELIDEPLVDEPSPSTDEIDAEHESTDAGPYADLYDPRAQRNPPEEADSAPPNEPGEPPSA